nr:triacylglycerol lipase 2-like [Tanacetum cinerariifolium]
MKSGGRGRTGNIGIGGRSNVARFGNQDGDCDDASRTEGRGRGRSGPIGIGGSSNVAGLGNQNGHYDDGSTSEGRGRGRSGPIGIGGSSNVAGLGNQNGHYDDGRSLRRGKRRSGHISIGVGSNVAGLGNQNGDYDDDSISLGRGRGRSKHIGVGRNLAELGSRPYFPHNLTTAALLAASNADGICSSMVQPRGYTCEEHKVTTKDGYVLSLQRIPLGRAGGKEGSQVPILLQHGLLMDGITWLLSPPDQSLALVLADNDFDVWIVSSRGTKYSRGHVSLKPEDEAYWDWSWDELSAYDLPATFQYVQSQTGQKLHYVGHSLGTLTAMAAFSKGELVSMLRSAALLSPVAYALKWLGLHEFHPRGDVVTKFLKKICAKPGIDCTNLLNSFTGKNCCLKPSIVDVFLDHEPQPSSTKNMMHVAEMIREGTIQMYDYQDAGENRRRYGQSTPPAYNIENIPKNVPLFLSHGGADALSDVEDVKHLLRTLKDHDHDKIQVQFIQDYAHADFVMATNAKQAVYEPLMAFFKLH